MLSIGVVTFKLWFESHRGSFASNNDKLLTDCVLRSTQPPTLSGMGNEQELTGYGVKA